MAENLSKAEVNANEMEANLSKAEAERNEVVAERNGLQRQLAAMQAQIAISGRRSMNKYLSYPRIHPQPVPSKECEDTEECDGLKNG